MALVPKHILNLSPYKAGRPIDEVRRELGLKNIIKLASNENPLGPSPMALAAVDKSLSKLHRYPDSSGYILRSRLAELFDLDIRNTIIGAGSEGIMSNIMRTFLRSDDEIVAAKNSFIGFRVLANASGARVNWVPMDMYKHNLKAMAGAINEYTKIIYLANPDNPTGSYFSIYEFDEFMSYVPSRVLVILDEAYFEYAQEIEDYPDSMHYRYDNVITLRTFSKIYGLAGLRVGYGFAHHDLIENLLKVKLPFEPSVIAQNASVSALDDHAFVKESKETNKDGKKYLQNIFESNGVTYFNSATNFLMIEMPGNAKQFCDFMLSNGIILRHLESFGLIDCVRVSIGTIDEIKTFEKAVKNFFVEAV